MSTADQPRPATARDPGVPRGQGPVAVLRRRDRSCTTLGCSRTYEVRDGIPVMLIDEATAVDDAEADRLTAKAAADGVEPTFSVD